MDGCFGCFEPWAMKVLEPAAIPFATGYLILAIRIRKSKGLLSCPLRIAPFQTQILSTIISTLLFEHIPNAVTYSTSTDAQTPPLTSHRDRNEIKGRENLLKNTVSSPSLSSTRLSSPVRRSTHTTLREKPGSGGQGPGTQQLSRQAKLAISVLIDEIGVSSYTVPGLGEVCLYNPFASGICVESPKNSNRQTKILLAVQVVTCPTQRLYEVQGTVFPPSDLEVLLALCRRNLGGERHRHAIALPDKLGTDPMAYGGILYTIILTLSSYYN